MTNAIWETRTTFQFYLYLEQSIIYEFCNGNLEYFDVNIHEKMENTPCHDMYHDIYITAQHKGKRSGNGSSRYDAKRQK